MSVASMLPESIVKVCGEFRVVDKQDLPEKTQNGWKLVAVLGPVPPTRPDDVPRYQFLIAMAQDDVYLGKALADAHEEISGLKGRVQTMGRAVEAHQRDARSALETMARHISENNRLRTQVAATNDENRTLQSRLNAITVTLGGDRVERAIRSQKKAKHKQE